MNKLIAAAALAAAVLVVPVAPVQADTLKDYFDSCWFMPLLKDECAPTAPAAASAAPKAMSVSVRTVAEAFEWPEPLAIGTRCSPAPEGSKFLLVCE